MGARYINNDGTPIKKVVGAKKQYEKINGVFEPVFYDGYVLYNGLKSDGTAYIDLGHKGDSTHRYELDFEYQLDAADDANWKLFFGARYSQSNREISILKGPTLTSVAVMQQNSSNGIRKSFTLDHLNHRYKISISKSSISINIDGTTSTTANTVTTDFVTPFNLLAFNVKDSDAAKSYPTDLIFHSIKEYDANGVLLYHYVPARKLVDDVLGLLDVVNGVFYTNVAGSGSFSV